MTRGFGTITKTRNGYDAEIRVGHRRLRKRFPTKLLADTWLNEMRMQRVEVASGAVKRGRARDLPVKYKQLAEQWLTWVKSGHDKVRTASTIEGYEQELGWLLARWGDRRVSETTEAQVATLVAEMRGAKLSSSTIRNRLDRLSQLHRFAVDRRYLMAEPCRIQRPKLTLKSGRTATSEAELEQALASCSDPELRAVLLLAADAGLRASEIVRLKGEDVAAGWITVAVRSESDRTKSGKARRVPLLTDRLIQALAEIEPQRNKPVVGLSYDQIAPRVKRFGIRLHELRHRFATRLLTAGEPLLRVQGWLGHADARTTQAYAHVPDEPSNKARGALE